MITRRIIGLARRLVVGSDWPMVFGGNGPITARILASVRGTPYAQKFCPSPVWHMLCSMPVFFIAAGWQYRNIMADSDKKPMSRLMKLANKFNCFYLSGKWKQWVILTLFRIMSIGASPSQMIDRYARLPSMRTTENIDFDCCVYLSLRSETKRRKN